LDCDRIANNAVVNAQLLQQPESFFEQNCGQFF